MEAIASSGRMKSKGRPAFNAQAFLDSAGVARKVVEFQIKATIFAQGDPAKTVMYIQKGRVKLSVVNATGKRLTIQGALDRMRPKLRSDKAIEWLYRTAWIETTAKDDK
jgi:CRP-like cAMP-binding protein